MSINTEHGVNALKQYVIAIYNVVCNAVYNAVYNVVGVQAIEKLEFLKISPRKTYTTLRYFLKNRNSTGTVAFTDHDTDKAYDQILPHLKPELAALRGVEWGGRTHMGLVGIKKNWEDHWF